MADIEQQARELLAAEYDKAGERAFAKRAREGRYDNDPDMRAIVAALASQPQAPAAAVPEDTARLDWLDAQNVPLRMGWDVSKAPAGDVSVQSVVFLGREVVPIRAAIDAARLAAAPAPEVSR